ncbi:hypothetical protein BURK2_00464 [Burkholderiales bacterium]|nr:MAG: hypothetical protein F9K47_18695 [Burkholderiales bacterium]CAG0955900.1 hypothetical protein BURK2_00464 [Burkholderiales bacterium]
MRFENPSPMTLTWHTYTDQHFGCNECGWQGKGDALIYGDSFSDLVELDCPACQTKVSFVMYPTLAESRANWERLSAAEKAWVETIEKARAEFDAICLKTPEQLPAIEEPEFSLAWDMSDEGQTVLRLADRVIFSEPPVFEGYERFEEVARILKARYGTALRDLVPTQASATYLYGDSLTASDRIAGFRRELFGGSGRIER